MAKFDCIVIDNPWFFDDRLSMSDTPRGAEANYSLMSNSDLMKLDIQSLASPTGCILALWVPGSLLQIGLDCMKSYGFEQKQVYVWCKTKKDHFKDIQNITKISLLKQFNIGSFKSIKELKKAINLTDMVIGIRCKLENTLSFGLGRLFRQSHEICLIGINNNGVYKKLKNRSQRSVSFAENIGHSSKPEELQNSLELMIPDGKYIELFARRQRNGWTCIGNQSPTCMGEDIFDSIERIKHM